MEYIFALAFIVTLILIVTQKYKWASLTLVVPWGLLGGTMLSLIYLYAIPVDKYALTNIHSSIITYWGVVCISCFMYIMPRPIKIKKSMPERKTSLVFKWLYFGFGVIVGMGGLLIVLSLIYIKKYNTPFKLYFAISAFLLCSLISSVFLYISSRLNSERSPNFMRWVVLVFLWLEMIGLPVILSLLLIYALPFEPKMSEPLASSLCFWGTVFYSLLVIKMASEYSSPSGNRTPSPRKADSI